MLKKNQICSYWDLNKLLNIIYYKPTINHVMFFIIFKVIFLISKLFKPPISLVLKVDKQQSHQILIYVFKFQNFYY